MAAITISTDARDEARFHEQVAQQYHHWVAYLTTQLQLLDLQARRSQVAFEYAESQDGEEKALKATLAGIPPVLRTLFDAVIEHERQEVQCQLITEQRPLSSDPDETIRLALQGLLDDANGERSESGRGLLPRGTPDEVRWYEVDTSVLQAAPNAATYAAGSPAADPKRLLTTVGGAAALIVLLIVWMVVPKGSAPKAGPLVARANATPVALWPVDQVVLGDSDRLTISLTASTSSTWPALDKEQTRGAWQTTSLYPIRMCVPGKALGSASTLTLPAQADRPARHYTLSAERPATQPDLLVEACAGDTTQRYGVLRTLELPADQPLDQPVVLTSESSLTVQSITLIGSGQEPTLPAGQARVAVRVVSDAALDWPTLAPTLLLPSGVALLPSETIELDPGIELRYLVPEPAEPLAVAWSIAPEPDAPFLRWRATLPLPSTRQAIVREALDITDVQATQSDTPGMVRVTIQITNRGSTPLVLTPETIQIAAQERVLASLSASAAAPLNPGEQRSVVIDAPEHPRLLLTVGVRRFAIEP